jgi:hypothetical protein
VNDEIGPRIERVDDAVAGAGATAQISVAAGGGGLVGGCGGDGQAGEREKGEPGRRAKRGAIMGTSSAGTMPSERRHHQSGNEWAVNAVS